MQLISATLQLKSWCQMKQQHFHDGVLCVQLIMCVDSDHVRGLTHTQLSVKTCLRCKHRTSNAFLWCHYESGSETEIALRKRPNYFLLCNNSATGYCIADHKKDKWPFNCKIVSSSPIYILLTAIFWEIKPNCSFEFNSKIQKIKIEKLKIKK